MAYSISATDDHCYPGTTVLINKLDIRDQEKLNEAELFIVSVKSLQFEMEPFPEDLDFAYYCELSASFPGRERTYTAIIFSPACGTVRLSLGFFSSGQRIDDAGNDPCSQWCTGYSAPRL